MPALAENRHRPTGLRKKSLRPQRLTASAEARTHFERHYGTCGTIPFPKPVVSRLFPQLVETCPDTNLFSNWDITCGECAFSVDTIRVCGYDSGRCRVPAGQQAGCRSPVVSIPQVREPSLADFLAGIPSCGLSRQVGKSDYRV